MISIRQYLQSSLGRKWLMAITGLVLVLFVMGHMLGNLLIFLGREVINAYAYKLHSIRSNHDSNPPYSHACGWGSHLDGGAANYRKIRKLSPRALKYCEVYLRISNNAHEWSDFAVFYYISFTPLYIASSAIYGI